MLKQSAMYSYISTHLDCEQVGLTFTAAAAATQTPPDNQTDGILRGWGLALCYQGNRALGRWRKASILRWEICDSRY